MWSCERFYLYVYARDFELETDHKSLECIYNRTSKPSARIERWVLRLQGYNYEVVYRPGKGNTADALSRLNQANPKDGSGEDGEVIRMIAEESTPVALMARDVERASENDPELTSVRYYIQHGNWDECNMPHYLCVKDELCVLGKLVLRGTRIVIPQSLRKEVLRVAHEGPQGIEKTKQRLRTKVWWPRMDHEAERMCKSCHGCQVVGQLSPPEPMQRTELPTGPWQDIAIDLMGPWQDIAIDLTGPWQDIAIDLMGPWQDIAIDLTGPWQYIALDLMGPLPTGESLLVVVDYYSRYFDVEIMQSTTTEKVVKALIPIFARHGYPFSLKSDNGRQ